MDVIDRLIQEWSWRCEKGYPDLSNSRDIAILKEIFNVGLYEALSYDNLSPEAQEQAKAISGEFNIPLEDIKAYGTRSNNRIVVYADVNRRKFFEELEEFGFERDTSIKGSSQGGVRKGDVEVIHKPKTVQKFGGAGKENESIFIDTLNSLIAETDTPVDITITDGTRKVRVENIDKVEDASARGAKEYSKSDADLLAAGEVRLGVSIKKDGAIRWESLKTRFREVYNIFIEKAVNGQIPDLMLASREDAEDKYYMQNAEGKNYSRVFIKDFPKDFDEEIVFGKDKVVVAERDFSSSDFSKNGDEIIIRVTNLYENLDQIAEDGKLPIMAFAHHVGKKYGIEMRAFMEKALPQEGGKANTLTISYNDLMD